MSANDCQITADGPPELSMAGLPSWKDPRAATAVAGLPPGSWNCERYASSKSPCEIAEIAAANSDALVRDTFALADLEIAADLLAELKLKTPTDYVWIAVAIPAMGVSHEYAPDEFAVTYVDGNDDTITVKVKSVGISTELLMQDPAAPGGSKFALCVAPVGTARGAQLTYTDARCACDSLHRSIPAQAREFVFLLIEEPPAGTDLTVEIGGTRYSWGECAGICEPPPACSTVKIGSEADGFNPAEFTLT
ncbi:MAG TPA: hypothetical protein VKY66_04865 [Protaetiibacter sp.]|nr:hypothetical protein [Protaetiibacter sp.]